MDMEGGRVQETYENISPRHTVGFACHQGSLYALFYMGHNAMVTLGGLRIECAALVATLAFMVFGLFVIRNSHDWVVRFSSNDSFILACSLLVMAGSLSPALAVSDPALGMLLEGLLVGIPIVYMLVSWGAVLGSGNPHTSALEVIVATGIASGACVVIWFLPEVVQTVCVALFPVGSALLLISSLTDLRDEETGLVQIRTTKLSREVSAPRRLFSGKVISAAVVYGIVAGFMETYRSEPGSASTPAIAAVMLILLLFSLAAYQTLHDPTKEQGDFSSMYTIAVFVMMAGFLFAGVLEASSIDGASVVLAGFLGLVSTFTALFLSMAVVDGTDAATVFSRGFMALYAGELAGIVLGNLFDYASIDMVTPEVVLSLAGILALIAYFFILDARSFGVLCSVVDERGELDHACDILAEQAHLSPREKEVLALAAHGRTNERIAQELYIAKSTADTHMRRIYGKTGVHNRQELIDLLERIGRERH